MNERFDIVVVGAGSSGSVIAARLGTRTRKKVLLIEAGPDYPDSRDLPPDLSDGNDNSYTEHDWGFHYRPSPEAKPEQDYPRGRVIGGSSAVNTCIALRGDPTDYDEWSASGCPEWSWEKCLPYLVRLESDLDFHDDFHGTDGPLPIRRYRRDELVPWQAAILEAMEAAGYPYAADLNAPAAHGAGCYPMNKVLLEDGVSSRRISAADAWLTPEVRSNPNLTVLPDTLVVRAVVDRIGAGYRVGGVEIVPRSAPGGSPQLVETGCVVIAAGAVMTPAILVRSGIGPRSTLDSLGISPVIASEAVGTGLYEHPACLVICLAKQGTVAAGHPVVQTTLRYTSEVGRAEGQENDMQLETVSFLPGMGESLVALNTIVERSYSTGRIEIVSASPDAHPVIEPNMLSDERDAARMLEGVRISMELCRSDQSLQLSEGPYRPRDEEVFGPDESGIAWCKKRVFSGFHPAGTARMGSPDDPTTVADQYGRVHGVDGLRVADASIMPMIPRSNLNVTCLMIGEKMADFIEADL